MAIPGYGLYNLKNIMGNRQAGTANVLPAVLATWSNLLGNAGNETQYSLYKQQAKDYIDTARRNADLIKSKGEIALRNLEYKDKLARGRDLAIAGAGNGNMTGSNLDVVTQKEKIRKMDEATLKANYTNQAFLELSNGYSQAYNMYGTLAAKADADKWGALAAIAKGFEVYTQLQTRDAKVISKLDTGKELNQVERNVGIDKQNKTYATPYRVRRFEDNLSTDSVTRAATGGNLLLNSESYSDDITPIRFAP